MGNEVTPSFSSQSPSVKVKTYGYGGKTVSKPQLFEYTDMPEIDYSKPAKKSKGIHTAIPVEKIDHLGLEDEEQKEFIKKLKEIIEEQINK